MRDIALTSQEKHQLLAVLRELDQDAPPENRRDPRRKVLQKLNIQLFQKGRKTTAVKATLVNVSTQGVGLVLAQSLEKGHKFLLPLRFQEGGGWLVLCEVRNSAPTDDDQFKVGGRFLDKIDDPSGHSKPPLDWLL